MSNVNYALHRNIERGKDEWEKGRRWGLIKSRKFC